MIEGLKPFYNSLLIPLVRPLVKIGIRPNHLTIAGCALFIVASWFVYKGAWTTASLFAIAGALFDGLDGVVARESNRKTTFGAILDSCCDRITEIVLIFGVLGYLLTAPIISFNREHLSQVQRAHGVIFCYSAITLSLMVSYVKARCEGAGIACRHGILQRPERLILLFVGLVAGPRTMVWILAVITILAGITVVQRFVEAYKKAGK
jgi:CDP-diacylglycerol---glycerol-3-phosphate 3-phosphatidyltransferase